MKNLIGIFLLFATTLFSQPACIPDGCSYVSNSSFESNSGCGSSLNNNVSCWGYFFGSPDIFTRNCTTDLCRKIGYNTYNVTTCQASPAASESYSGPGTGNNAFVGVFGGKWGSLSNPGYGLEGMETHLTNPLVNGQQYVISFWGKVNKDYAGIGASTNKVATIDFHAFPTPLLLGGNLTSPLSTYAPSTVKLGNSAYVPNDDKWHYIQQVITYNGPTGNSYLGAHYNLFDPMYSSFSTLNLYAYLDDITLNPIGTIPVVTNPLPICLGQTVSNLSGYVSMSGGTFTGPGVVFSHGQYSFNSSGLAAGTYIVFHNYTNSSGCVYHQAIEITVLNGSVAATIAGKTICAGSCTTLTPIVTGTAPFTYSWNTLPVATTSSISVCPTTTKSYILTVTNSLGCKALASANVIVNPIPNLSVSTTTVCAGTVSPVTALGAVSYSWAPSAGLSCTNCANPSINTTALTIYTVTGTSNGCVATKTVTVKAGPAISVSATPPIICLGESSVLAASGANSYLWSANAGNSSSASVNVTPSSTTTYSVNGTNTIGCTSTKTVSVVTCVQNVCSYVVNGDFENNLGCSSYLGNGMMPCWKDLIGSADIFTRACSSNLCRKIGYNTYNVSSCNISTSASESYSGAGTGNDGFIGLYGGRFPSNYYQEGAQTKLGNALVNGQQYVISFWAKVNKDYAGLGAVSNVPATIDFHAFPNYQTYTSNFNTSFSATYPSSVKLGNSVQIANDNTWHYMQQTFTYTGATGNSYMSVSYNVFAPIYNGLNNMNAYVYLDDIALNQVNTIPIVSNPPILCIGQNIPNLMNYVSIPGGTFTGTGVVFSNGVYSFNSTGLYSGNHNVFYNFTNANGCTYKQALLVTLAPESISVSVPSKTICAPGCATLAPTVSGAPATSYSWNTNPAATTSSVVVCPTNSTNYQVTVTNSLGCVATATANVIVNQTPVLTVSNQTICATTNYTLNAAGATTYTWAPSTGLSCTNCANPVINTSVSTVYTITGASNNCTTTKTINVTSIPLPVITIEASQYTLCEGTSTVLTTSVNIPGGSIHWNTGNTTSSISVSPSVTTTYTVDYTTACGVSYSQATVNIISLPTIAVSPNYTAFCTPTSVTLTALYTNAAVNTFAWSTGATTNTIDVTPLVTTVYTASVSNACGIATDATTIAVGPPNLFIQQSVMYPPCGLGPVQAILTASGGTQYTWSPTYALNATTGASVIAMPTVLTNYTLTAEDANGCINTATVDVQQMYPYPADAGPDFSICANTLGTYVLGTPAQAGFAYDWQPTTYLSQSGDAQPTLTYPGGGAGSFPITYTLVTTNPNKCFSTSYVTVSLNYGCRIGIDAKTIENQSAVINVFPNPNNGNFEVIANRSISNASLILLNLIGEVVYKDQLTEFMTKQILVEDFPSGIYYLQVISNTDSVNTMLKIIKQ